MAKWGEGDPRWLVEERPDAKNVNNWHWAEKNASHWSKDKFNELFLGARIETDFGRCEIIEISKCEGDAVVNNRKGKLIFIYEWVIEMKWQGAVINGDTDVKGSIQIPNLSEEHEIKDVDVNVYAETSGSEAEILKDMMRSTGLGIIREKLSSYLISLKEEFSKNLILPTKDTCNSEVMQTGELNKKNESSCHNTERNSNEKEKFETTDLHYTENFKCSAEEFYGALTIKELVQAFTQGNCVLEPEEGGKFELFDGNVHGHFLKLVPNKKIIKKWRFKTWPKDHFSIVIIDIEEKVDSTEVKVSQTGVPKTEFENTYEGWKRFYWNSMKRILGFGVPLF